MYEYIRFKARIDGKEYWLTLKVKATDQLKSLTSDATLDLAFLANASKIEFISIGTIKSK